MILQIKEFSKLTKMQLYLISSDKKAYDKKGNIGISHNQHFLHFSRNQSILLAYILLVNFMRTSYLYLLFMNFWKLIRKRIIYWSFHKVETKMITWIKVVRSRNRKWFSVTYFYFIQGVPQSPYEPEMGGSW